MSERSVLQNLVDTLKILPGVGPKSAQRMALYLLERERHGALRLADALREAVEKIGHCKRCRTLTELEVCRICANPARQVEQLCIVETPADVLAIEQASVYRGLYFVLMGHLSPLDGIGPEELGLDELERRFGEGEVQEVILATNPTVEGEVTAHYISELAAEHGISTTRLAHGIPIGGELEYADSQTLSHAFQGRKQY